jgi:hypothetical protein
MKNILLIIAVVCTTQFNFAQDFKPSKDYIVALENPLSENEDVQVRALLQAKSDVEQNLSFFPLVYGENINEILISTLENPVLNGVERVIKVDVTYIEYCTYTISNYILETTKGDYISLPMLTNEDCNDEPTQLVYLFPSQTFGQENKILTSQVVVDSNTIKEAFQEDSFIWNDDSYGASGQLYEEL